MSKTHLDTREHSDSVIMGLYGPGGPGEGEEGLIITSSLFGDRCLEVQMWGPDGEVQILGRGPIARVRDALNEALAENPASLEAPL